MAKKEVIAAGEVGAVSRAMASVLLEELRVHRILLVCVKCMVM